MDLHDPKISVVAWVANTSIQLQAEMRAVRARQLSYRGTEIQPSTASNGEELTIQQQIAAAFSKSDPVPSDRRTMFDWCYSHSKLKVLGWYGVIKRTSRETDGWLVEVRISPQLAGVGAVTYTTDYCLETWKYSNDGKLVFQSCVRFKDTIRLLMGD